MSLTPVERTGCVPSRAGCVTFFSHNTCSPRAGDKDTQGPANWHSMQSLLWHVLADTDTPAPTPPTSRYHHSFPAEVGNEDKSRLNGTRG